MQVIDEISGKRISIESSVRVVVNQVGNLIVYGFCKKSSEIVSFGIVDSDGFLSETYLGSKKALKDILIFSNKRGMYLSKIGMTEDCILQELYTKGYGEFPYNIQRNYEAIDSLELFKGKQKILGRVVKKEYHKYLKYSFGLEFETSRGYIPEDLCFRDGLIPLRDGSITGIEYSTVILNGDKGIQLLKQQLVTLDKYTEFDKDCSLHVHIGGYPLSEDKIYRLYSVCKYIERDLQNILPPQTFDTKYYKTNGKDYCKRLSNYLSFEHLYKGIVGRGFFGDFTQPHPRDIYRKRKWEINSRYFWVNFVNILCYNVNKTVEFRFLRPTYSFNKIMTWLYILNAIMLYAESEDSLVSLRNIIRHVYSKDLSEKVLLGIKLLKILKESQVSQNDLSGSNTYMERNLFGNELF